MPNTLLHLARPIIRKMRPYASAKRIAQHTHYQGQVWLDANLSPVPPYPNDGSTDGLQCYADPQPAALRHALAQCYGITPEQLCLTRGSDEGIDLLIRTFCEANQDRIMICSPTFSMYARYARIQGATVIDVPLCQPDFQLDLSGIIKAHIRTPVKLFFIPSPHAPLGHLICRHALYTLCQRMQSCAWVVIDEAYIEFANTPSMAQALNTLPNLIVLRTLSKAHGMAGLRIGCLIGPPDLIRLLEVVHAPYPLTVPSIRYALQALSPAGLLSVKQRITQIQGEREQLKKRLLSLPFVEKVYPSVSNFLLIQVKDANRLYHHLAKKGIIIRDQTTQIPQALRISIGSQSDNNRLWSALQSYSDA